MARDTNTQTGYSGYVVFILLAVTPGCDSTESKISPNYLARKPKSTASYTVSAGLIFANETSYQCVPLDKLRISNTVVSLSSTCECIRPTIVVYQVTSTETAKALRLDFQDVEASNHLNELSRSLSVIVTLCMTDGTTQSVVVDVVYGHQMKPESSPGTEPS